jgi:hypothetical protein
MAISGIGIQEIFSVGVQACFWRHDPNQLAAISGTQPSDATTALLAFLLGLV